MYRTYFYSVAMLAITSLCPLASPAQDIEISAPTGWRGETIELPPEFAPEMKVEGWEELRFSPGMFEKDSDSFFSYVFVFEHAEPIESSQEFIKSQMLEYYRGLSKAVLGDEAGDVDFETFEVELNLIADEDDARFASGRKTYRGTLQWVEPFVTREAQTLHFEIRVHEATASARGYWFVCVSPADKTADVWAQMYEIQDDFEKTR